MLRAFIERENERDKFIVKTDINENLLIDSSRPTCGTLALNRGSERLN